jgi:hypothetical protein
VQGENLQQVRLNRQAIQADAIASPEGRGPGWAEAILHDPPIKKEAPLGRFFRFRGTDFTVQGENLQQVRLNRQAIQADAIASPEGRGPGWAEAILHDPPIKKEVPLGRFFRFCYISSFFKSKALLAFKIVGRVWLSSLSDRACAENTVRSERRKSRHP